MMKVPILLKMGIEDMSKEMLGRVQVRTCGNQCSLVLHGFYVFSDVSHSFTTILGKVP